MSLHGTNEFRDKTHRDRLHVDLVTSQNELVLPKLPPKERGQHNRHKHEVGGDNDSLFRLFKDQNTIDILRHKNISQFKHTTACSKGEDFEEMMREIELQKDEVIKQMKIWTRVSEAALKGEVQFSENDYSELHNSFYKWLLFIEQSYSSYEKIENSLPPPLLHSPNNAHSANHYNEEMIKKSPHAHLTHLKAEKEEHQRQIQRLNLIIKDLNSEIDVGKIRRLKLQSKIQELDGLLTQAEAKNQKYQLRTKEVNKKIVIIVTESQQFLADLKSSINQGKDLKSFIEKIDEKVLALKEYKQSLK